MSRTRIDRRQSPLKPEAVGARGLEPRPPEKLYDTERHLLYVACTRARDFLLVTGVDPVSEFLDDLMKGDQDRAA